MNNLSLVMASLALFAAIAALLLMPGTSDDSGPRIAERGLGEDADALREELERQADHIARLERQIADAPKAPVDTKRFEGRLPPRPRPTPGDAPERSAQWYLDQYVLSFDSGSRGSEYFRLATEAHAHLLSYEMSRIIVDPSYSDVLRRELLKMLGQSRFRADSSIIQLALDVLDLEAKRSLSLLDTALNVLSNIGTRSTAVPLEARVWNLPRKLQSKALELLVRLAGPDVNTLLVRLFVRAPDDVARQRLVAIVRPGGDDSALDFFREASRAAQPVRLTAAKKIGSFRTDAFIAFVDEWIAREQDEAVRRALGAAKSRQSMIPNWHPMKAVGPPDAADPGRDSPNAWASLKANGGREWLEVTYARPQRANLVRIYEVLAAGGVTEVITIDTSGRRRTVWKGRDPTRTPSVFQVSFATTSYRVRAIRIVLDTSSTSGWNEIDAVELVGPGSRAWASSARASSTYAR